MAAKRPVLVIHGGAGPIRPDADLPAAKAALRKALGAGGDVLHAGGSAIDAVVAAVETLERSGCFNAGRGAVLDATGAVTLDAAVMDGRSRGAGGVAALSGHAGAVAIARAVMDRTSHVLLVGAGAAAFAAANGFSPAVSAGRSGAAAPSEHGTVGAVALDASGGLACATSTGGVHGKLPGRVGDSPLIGAGTYADDRCAVSATGAGEYFVRSVFAYRISAAVKAGASIADASSAALADVVRLGGSGGCIALGRDGSFAMPMVTEGMFRAVLNDAGAQLAVYANEALSLTP